MKNLWLWLGLKIFSTAKRDVIFSKAKRDAVAATKLSVVNVSNAVAEVDVSAANATFKITDTKLHVPVVTLSTEDDNNFLEKLKSGFKRTTKWNKYRSEMTNQAKTNNFNYFIDPIFNKVNRLFVTSFENEEDRAPFSKYYKTKFEIKDFNVLVGGKSFFWCASKKKKRSNIRKTYWDL